MRKFYSKVVKYPKIILAFFGVLTILGAVLQKDVGVNYEVEAYLPEETKSTVSLEVMREEFEGGIPNARVMVRNVTLSEALEYKEKIEVCDGVSEVLWLDDTANIYQPLETLDSELVETYYKDNNALFTVTVEEEKRIEAVDEIRAIIGEENAMMGDAVSTAVATTGTVKEILVITIFAIMLLLVVLVITTSSWAEPFIILIGLGVAVLINSGSNLIFGEISFVTNAAGPILQMAVSLDYSVFLIHRYEECLRTNTNKQDAMVEALCKSTSSILSSGLTTVIGFFALIFMRFKLGSDLGIAFAVVMVPAFIASNRNTYYYAASKIYGEETQLGQDIASIEEVFGKSDTYVVLVPNGNPEAERKLSDALNDVPEIKSIISYAETVGAEIPKEYLDADTLSQLVSENYNRMVLTVETDYEGLETFELVEEIRGIVDTYYPEENYLAGEGVSSYDLMDTITADNIKVNLIAIGAVFVVLLLSMKSLVLPVILVLAIETVVWINMSIPCISGSVVFYISYLIISSVQLGATVDYAILLTDRYLELRQSMLKKEAVWEVIPTVTISLLTSGTVLAVVGMLLSKFSTHGMISQLGLYLGRGTILSLISVFFVLPGLLYIFDKAIQKTTLGILFYQSGKEQE